ncbi:uncharacterized protein IL334_005831 [Kwoniella shivajii]|uniref:Phosphatidylglycerol/phosphatidylinositol transfer protein n=1 Tax=Kwoniella shivajii TaxID=564305 RepID=A0ABZ1D4M2_9TREE|nr:hypothetical protein IL334_005831 [Kwoniella shivajii]
MHTSVLLALLPLLALQSLAAPQRGLPLPAILRRQEQAQQVGALDLPPSLNTASPTIDPSIDQSASATVADIDDEFDLGPTAMPTLWEINTVPQTLLAQNQNQNHDQAQPTITPSPTGLSIMDPSEDVMYDSINQPSPTPTPIPAPTEDMALDMTAAITEAAMTSIAAVSTSYADPSSTMSSSATVSTSYMSQSAIPTPTSNSMSGSSISHPSITSFVPSSTTLASINMSTSTSAGAPSMTVKAASSEEPSSSSDSDDEHSNSHPKGKKIRYKHCSDIHGTVTDIRVEPCQGGKGTILDPCQFHAGNNYTITLSYVSPDNSTSPRTNLVARDKSASKDEYFPYPGQSFDACQYTSCPVQNQEVQTYTYEFVTLNNRFDQLTFNMTDGLDGESLMCAYFPITFMPNLAGRSVKRNLPFAGLGARW